MLELYGCRPGALDDVEDIREALIAAAATMGGVAGRTILETCPTGVHGYGLGPGWRVALRTWTAANFALIDIAAGGPLPAGPARAILEHFFAPERVQMLGLDGGLDPGGGEPGPGQAEPGRQKVAVSAVDQEIRVYVNDDLQFSAGEELRYHESMVVPALALARDRSAVLLLGGGFGLCAREVLQCREVRTVTVVELDQGVVDLARQDSRLVELNQGALLDPRVQVAVQDAYHFLESTDGRYGVIVADLPDPEDAATDRLYSSSFYRLVASRLQPGGIFVTHGTSPAWTPGTYWSIVQRLQGVGLHVLPYHLDIPSCGDRGFVLASDRELCFDRIRLPRPTRFLTRGLLQAMAVFGKDALESARGVNGLPDEPLYLRYLAEAEEGEG